MQKTARAKPDLLECLSAANFAGETGAAPALHSAQSPPATLDARRQSEERQDEFRFRIAIRRPKNGTERILAYTSDIAIARAIFSAATKQHPDLEIKLCEGSRIIEQTTSQKSNDL